MIGHAATSSRSRRRGMGSVFAVLSLVLMAAAALALTSLVRLDAGRTENTRTEAQLTQLLRVGADATQAQLDAADPDGGKQRIEVELPEALADARLSVKITPDAAGEQRLHARVIAEFAGHRAEQTLVWNRDPSGRWVAVEAVLNRTR